MQGLIRVMLHSGNSVQEGLELKRKVLSVRRFQVLQLVEKN